MTARRDLPERAVQFGTGALLRGLVDYLLHESNKAGKFNGRVVAIGSTGSGRDNVINSQNGLFTLLTEGMEKGQQLRKYERVSSLSRALSAVTEWDEVLAVARNPDIEVIFSNTTEVGIGLEEGEDPDLAPPKSFPAKLTRFLLERAKTFEYDAAKGVIVLPCELIERNGDALRGLVVETTRQWNLDDRFSKWIAESVSFGNTLVDRIVSGKPAQARMPEIEKEMGYADEMVTVCEPYRLFAIEGDARIRRWVERCTTDAGFFATDDIEPYRQRKVRILNGGHTTMVPAALLAGCVTVHDAMTDKQIGDFVRTAILDEIVPTLRVPDAERFAMEVLERFENPYIEHALIDITLHGTAKMKVRVIPTILAYTAKEGSPPVNLTFGFAAHLVFMRGDIHAKRAAKQLNVPTDGAAERIRESWRSGGSVGKTVADLCADVGLWGSDLTPLPGFVQMVTEDASAILREGIRKALLQISSPEKAVAS